MTSNLLLSTSLEDHSTDLLQKIKDLLAQNALTDVSLVTEDHTRVEAHKLILSAVSPTFREMFTNSQHSHPMIFLKGVSRSELQSLIDFIYNGEASLLHDSLEQFMSLGKTFQVSGLGNSHENVKTEKEDEVEKEVMILPCEFCDFTARDLEDLNFHHSSVHPNPDDEKDIAFDEATHRVIKIKNTKSNHTCKLCHYKCESKAGLKDHKQKVHIQKAKDDASERFICEICCNSYSHEPSLMLHMKVKHGKNGFQRLKCDRCGSTFNRIDTLREHIMIKHENTAKYMCELCDFKTMRPQKLKNHMMDCHK